VLFENQGGTLTESRFHLVIQFEVFAPIFRVGLVMWPGSLVLCHVALIY
jgi:hypothetical protein